jgi:prevent-host-death family protein
MNRRGEALLLRDEGVISIIFARSLTVAIGLESKMWAAPCCGVSGRPISQATCGDRATCASATIADMAVISQDELRNEIGAVLRRTELGERFTVTVAGRPVAELNPLPSTRSLAAPERLAAILAETPPDLAFAEDLRQIRR